MYLVPIKGISRVRSVLARIEGGEPKANFERNRAANCRFVKGSKAYRLKGRNRFKTGKKRQQPGKKSK